MKICAEIIGLKTKYKKKEKKEIKLCRLKFLKNGILFIRAFWYLVIHDYKIFIPYIFPHNRAIVVNI